MYKVLTLDIEKIPGLFYGWNIRDEPFYQLKGTTISCVAYKWAHEDKVHVVHQTKLQHKINPRADKPIIKKICKVINEADIIVGHNMARFDWKCFNARVIFHGLPPLKKPLVADTLTMSRSQTKFDSHTLEFLCRELGLPLKLETRKFAFVKAIKSWEVYKELIDYCGGDVIGTEALYNRLKPYCAPIINKGRLAGLEKACANCGSSNLIGYGKYLTKTKEVPRFRCKDCGSTANVETAGKKKLIRGVV